MTCTGWTAVFAMDSRIVALIATEPEMNLIPEICSDCRVLFVVDSLTIVLHVLVRKKTSNTERLLAMLAMEQENLTMTG